MSAISFEFPYRYRESGGKKLSYPEVKVQIQTFLGRQTYNFIFDSGADITTLPEYMISLVQIPKQDLVKSRSFGISSEPVYSLDAVIPVKIGSLKLDLPVTFVPNKDVPLLLGKEGIFDRFNIILDNDAQKTILQVR